MVARPRRLINQCVLSNDPHTRSYGLNFSASTGALDVPYPIPSYPPGQGMGYAKGYVPGYGVKHTLHYSFVLVFLWVYISPYPGPRVWRAYPLAEGTYPHARVHTRVWNIQDRSRLGLTLGGSIPGYVPGYEGMYPPPEGMLSIPWAQGMVKCTFIKH